MTDHFKESLAEVQNAKNEEKMAEEAITDPGSKNSKGKYTEDPCQTMTIGTKLSKKGSPRPLSQPMQMPLKAIKVVGAMTSESRVASSYSLSSKASESLSRPNTGLQLSSHDDQKVLLMHCFLLE